MPILWRYLLARYCKIFLLALASLLFLLFALRLDEITHFISQDATQKALLAFIGYQIPFLLPIAIPIACLTGSYLTSKELSAGEEMTAFRSQGIPLFSLFFPLLLFALLVGSVNFFLTSEVATLSHLETTLLKNQLKKINPLLFLHNKRILQKRGIIFDHMGNSKMGKWAEDVIIALPGKEEGQIHLVLAKRIAFEEGQLKAYEVTEVYQGIDQEAPLFLDNVAEITIEPERIASLFDRSSQREQEDLLPWKQLSQKWKDSEYKEIPLLSEMMRRVTLGLSPILFTFAGFSFGFRAGRQESFLPLAGLLFLTSLFLATFFIAKGLSDKKEATVLLYTVPGIIVVFFSAFRLFLLSRGRLQR